MTCPAAPPTPGGRIKKEIAVTMTVDTLPAQAPPADGDTPDVSVSAAEKSPAKKTVGKKAKTLELTLTVIGTADGEWRAELKRGTTYLARNLAVAAAAVSCAARELHEDLSTPIDSVIEEARTKQAAKVAALEAELEAARAALADLDSDS
jgi:hypothetical protein